MIYVLHVVSGAANLFGKRPARSDFLYTQSPCRCITAGKWVLADVLEAR